LIPEAGKQNEPDVGKQNEPQKEIVFEAPKADSVPPTASGSDGLEKVSQTGNELLQNQATIEQPAASTSRSDTNEMPLEPSFPNPPNIPGSQRATSLAEAQVKLGRQLSMVEISNWIKEGTLPTTAASAAPTSSEGVTMDTLAQINQSEKVPAPNKEKQKEKVKEKKEKKEKKDKSGYVVPLCSSIIFSWF
jgi:hypothetical protein